MPTSISMKTFRKEIKSGILFWATGMCEKWCTQLLISLFISTDAFHSPSVRTQHADLWIIESEIILILESPKFCLCAEALKHIFFLLFFPSLPSFLFFSIFFPHISTSPSSTPLSPSLIFLSDYKVIQREEWLALLWKHYRSSVENYRTYLSCLSKIVVNTKIYTIQWNAIFRKKTHTTV